MSYSFKAYSIDLNELRTHALHTRRWDSYCLDFADVMKRHDAFFEDEIENGHPTLSKALYQLMNREDSIGYAQAYALEIVVEANGTRLNSKGLSVTRWSWIEKVDSELAKLEFKFQLQSLTTPPVRLPPLQDFPMVGFATREELKPLQLLPAHKDNEIELAFSNLRTWASQPLDIVTFYY